MKIPPDLLGLAAEFAVASELCRRRIYAQLTLGQRKRTDILVETEWAMLKIQVKGKQGKEWPAVKGIDEGEILILVDFENKKENEKPDFYVLTAEDWKRFLKKELKLTGKIDRGEVEIGPHNTPKWKDGFIGISIRPEQIKKHKERWDKIEKMVIKE